MYRQRTKWLSFILCLALLLSCLTGIRAEAASSFQIHFIDVGQADAALILCDGEAMLIDGGNRADSQIMYNYMQKMNVSHLDYVIGTHPHEDHIGGIAGALQYVQTIGTAYCSVTSYTGSAFPKFVTAVQNKGKSIQIPTVGTTFSLGSAQCKIIAVNTPSDDINDSSIVMRITYGDNSFMFTGDAELPVEQFLLNSNEILKSDVLKVGHHGSSSSTSYQWLREVDPDYAVIPVGSGNEYGHPTEKVLSRLRDAEVKTYRTDMQGDIVCTSDGTNITFTVARNPDADTFGGIGDNSTVTPSDPTSTAATSVKAGTPYKMAFDKGGTKYYFTGATGSASYYLATSTNSADAVTVYLEGETDCYRLYFYKGNVKTYIRVYERTSGAANQGKPDLQLTTAVPAETYRFDPSLKTLVHTKDANNSYYMGTYNSYTNIRASNLYYVSGSNFSKVDVSQFPARFYDETEELSITTQPVSKIINSGKTAKFTVAASGTELQYQWQYRTSSAGSWANAKADGNQTAALNVPGTVSRHGYQYRCRITDASGNKVYTDIVTLYVLGIKTQPASKAAAAGKTVKFTVKATGRNVTYQWQYRTSSAGSWKNAKADGNTTATLNVPATVSRHGYQYRCVIKDDQGNTTNTKTVNLYVLGVKTQPASKTAKAGASVKFAVQATGRKVTYQWQYRTVNGVWKNSPATGAQTPTLTTTAKASYNGNQYRCKITDTYGNVIYTDIVKLTVKK